MAYQPVAEPEGESPRLERFPNLDAEKMVVGSKTRTAMPYDSFPDLTSRGREVAIGGSEVSGYSGNDALNGNYGGVVSQHEDSGYVGWSHHEGSRTEDLSPPPNGNTTQMTPSSSPEPVLRNSSRKGREDIRHPAPGLQSLQGAYVGNVARLEQSAERLSMSPDVEQGDVVQDRRSFKSWDSAQEEQIGRAVNTDTGLHEANSYAVRPTHSAVHADSHGSAVRHQNFPIDSNFGPRAISTVGSSYYEVARDPVSSTIGGDYGQTSHYPEQLQGYEHSHIQLPVSHEDAEQPHVADTTGRPGSSGSGDTFQQARKLFHDFDGTHYAPSVRGPSLREPSIRAPSLRNPSLHSSDQHQDERILARQATYQQLERPLTMRPPPPPGDSMVFYPAPVPRMLNLPQKLSKQPTPGQRNKRQTQVLDTLAADARNSVNWLPDQVAEGTQPQDFSKTTLSQDERRNRVKSVQDLSSLPPQLRASAFFDYPSVPQDVELKGESAVATLDSILDASAAAPVSAFTDHPFAGQAGGEIYGRDKTARISSAPVTAHPESKAQRSSLSLLLGKRNSRIDVHSATSPLAAKANRSSRIVPRSTEEDVVLDNTELAAEEGVKSSLLPTAHRSQGSIGSNDELPRPASAAGQESRDGSYEHVEAPETDLQIAPTTLLAELQLRKEEQRHRNKTAATAFPQGMHSTLLEMDAVAQVQKKARKQKRINLAWEVSAESQEEPKGVEDDDEDVPLAMLYPQEGVKRDVERRGLPVQRPLGLMEQRDMEENEPLSVRRNRLKGGVSAADSGVAEDKSEFQLKIPGLDEDEPSPSADEEQETLGQRRQRLRCHGKRPVSRQTRTVSSDFASEMLSQFGGELNKEAEKPANDEAKQMPEETLGQRRRRLKAEREAQAAESQAQGNRQSTVFSSERPVVKQRHSMADILQAHPAAGSGRPALNMAQPPLSNIPHWPSYNQHGLLTSNPNFPLQSQAQTQPYHQPRHTMGVNVVANPMMYNQFQGSLNTMGNVGINQYSPDMNPRQRDMIDRWRQSVYP